MPYDKPITQIMWKEIFLIFIVLYVVRELAALYLRREHQKAGKQFYAGEWTRLSEKCKKLKCLAGVLAGGPLNPWIRIIYNDLCLIIGSIAYLNGDVDEFLCHIHAAKKEKTYAMADCCLALYYRSVHNLQVAERYYEQYQLAKKKDSHIACILDSLFSNTATNTESVAEAIKNLKNPALLKLLEDNGIFQ